MGSFKTLALTGALLLAAPAATFAADMPEIPPISEAAVQDAEFGSNWYLRGNVGYVASDLTVDRAFPASPLNVDDSGSTWSVGAGVGYSFGWFRADLTLDYFGARSIDVTTFGTACANGGASGPICSSHEQSDLSVLPVLLNAYFDLGNWSGFTPYVGAGAGVAQVQWTDWDTRELCDTTGGGTCPTPPHAGGGVIDFSNRTTDEWKFAWAVMAGFSYALNPNLSIDVGYRLIGIDDGKIVRNYTYATNPVTNLGPIKYEDMLSQEARIGFRYKID
jgi:opacity protein-like surface antigen